MPVVMKDINEKSLTLGMTEAAKLLNKQLERGKIDGLKLAGIAKVVAWASKMGKTPIVVNDCPGFFVNRVLFLYFAGFSQLLRDGADFRKIDKVMEKQFGWPMGPGVSAGRCRHRHAHHAQAVMAAGFPQRMQKDYRDAIDALFDANRFGQKKQSGLLAL